MDNKAGTRVNAVLADMAKLEVRPPDESVIPSIVAAISEFAEPSEQREAVEQLVAALDGQTASLVTLGRALYHQVNGLEQMAALPSIAALRIDGSSSEAVDVLLLALDFFSERAAVEPFVTEARRLTRDDLRLLAAWVAWLQRSAGGKEASVEVANDVVEAALAAAVGDPDDCSFVEPFAAAVRALGADAHRVAVERMLGALAGSAKSLTALGCAFGCRSWSSRTVEPRARDAAWSALIAAVRLDPGGGDAVDNLAELMGSFPNRADLEPRVVDAMELTGRDLRLVASWARWLASAASEESGEVTVLAAEVVAGVVNRAQKSPGEYPLAPFVSALRWLAPADRLVGVDHMRSALEGHAELLMQLARALTESLRPPWEWTIEDLSAGQPLADIAPLAAPVVLAALQAGATHEATTLLAGLLPRFTERSDIEPLVEDALAVSKRDLGLITSWAQWLDGSTGGADARAVKLAGEVVTRGVELLALDPNELAPVQPVAGSLPLLADPDREREVQRLLEVLADHPATLAALGRAMVDSQGESAHLACTVLVKAVEADPTSADAISALADSLGSVADLSTVKPIVEQALDRTGRNPELLTAWAARLSSDGTLLPETEAIVLEVGHRNPDLFAQLAPSIIDHYGERRLIDARRTWLDRLEVAGVDPNLLALWRCISQRDEDLPQRSERIAAAALGGQMGEELRRRWEQELFWSRMALGTMRSVDDIGPVVAERLAGGWDVLNDDDAVHYGLMATRIGIAGKDPAGARVALERTRNKVGRDHYLLGGQAAALDAAILALEDRTDLVADGLPIREARGLGDILTEPLASWRMKDMCLREALKSDDDQLAALYFEVGNTLGGLERYDEARRAYRRADDFGAGRSGPKISGSTAPTRSTTSPILSIRSSPSTRRRSRGTRRLMPTSTWKKRTTPISAGPTPPFCSAVTG